MPDFVTYCRNVFIPVTNICRNRCGYCGFRRDPGDNDAHLMPLWDIIPILKNGKKAGCTEVLFTFGEYAEEIVEYREWLNELGYSTTVEYVAELCKTAIDIGLLPHTNAGILDSSQLKVLKPLNASLGLMLETTAKLDADGGAHHNCAGKHPAVRLDAIKAAGKLNIPFTTGILVGIGETVDDRIDSLQAIANIHETYGHIQEVIIQNFMPKSGTTMSQHKPPTKQEMIQAVSLARDILPCDIAVQVAPNLIDPYLLVRSGASDLGGISPTTIDWINPEAEWPGVSKLQKMMRSVHLRERLPIYPQYIEKGWYGSGVKRLIETLADEDGYRKA
ncbi:MAG TPA: 7,8-didemethyl-8-hydroxy-5-deazariboflavin synthase subunit CofG [Methanosarcinaceae archaeon]|nr:7,8-didemethyl-8-hydroxy-5-deazariboflavin synthase subunit CofG [Methanosarcinaceae archaeon]